MNRHDLNRELYAQIRAGDKAAINKMIENNLGGITKLANDFIEARPECEGMREDLIGDARLEIVREVNRLATRADEVKSIKNFFVTAIVHSFNRTCDESALVGPGHSAQKKVRKGTPSRNRHLLNATYRRIANGDRGAVELLAAQFIEQRPEYADREPRILELCFDFWRTHDKFALYRVVRDKETRKKKRIVDVEHYLCFTLESCEFSPVDCDLKQIAARSDTDWIDARDAVASCCETDTERKVLLLRYSGMTDEEVADRISSSTRTVCRIRKRVAARYNERSLTIGA
jgi:hypothetical protein